MPLTLCSSHDALMNPRAPGLLVVGCQADELPAPTSQLSSLGTRLQVYTRHTADLVPRRFIKKWLGNEARRSREQGYVLVVHYSAVLRATAITVLAYFSIRAVVNVCVCCNSLQLCNLFYLSLHL